MLWAIALPHIISAITFFRQLSVSFAGETGEVKRYDKLRPTRDLLLCLLQVLRHVPQHHMVAYWNTMGTEGLMDFLTLLQ